MKPSEPAPGLSLDPVGSTSPMLGFSRAQRICLAPRLFEVVFVSLIVCVFMPFCWWPSQVFLRLWQFSAWSPLMCLSVYLLSQYSWFIYIYKSRERQQRIILASKGQIFHISCCLLKHLQDKVNFCGATYSQMLGLLFLYLFFIRYEVKSASRNMTNTSGKITSGVWIQSLWQLTADDTWGNFFRQQWWAILPSAGAENWQIGTKSRLKEINMWGKSGVVGSRLISKYHLLNSREGTKGHAQRHAFIGDTVLITIMCVFMKTKTSGNIRVSW